MFSGSRPFSIIVIVVYLEVTDWFRIHLIIWFFFKYSRNIDELLKHIIQAPTSVIWNIIFWLVWVIFFKLMALAQKLNFLKVMSISVGHAMEFSFVSKLLSLTIFGYTLAALFIQKADSGLGLKGERATWIFWVERNFMLLKGVLV